MKTQHAVRSLAALAQDTRLAIYRMLVQQGPDGLPAGTIAERLGLPAPTLSFHLKELTNAALIGPRQEGRFVYYSANYEQMSGLLAFLSENCCQGACAPASMTRQLRRSRRSASRRRP
jgi:DNA-binding transcriptional ArsR family regulator